VCAEIMENQGRHVFWNENASVHIVPVKMDEELKEIREFKAIWMTRIQLLDTVPFVPPVEIHVSDEHPRLGIIKHFPPTVVEHPIGPAGTPAGT